MTDDSRPQHDVYPVRRQYRPGEVEQIAVSTVVREALWARCLKAPDADNVALGDLVDEAARAAAAVMGRVAQGHDDDLSDARWGELGLAERRAHPAYVLCSTTGSPPRLAEPTLPEGWRGRLANVEVMLSSVIRVPNEGTPQPLLDALVEVRSLLDFDR